MQYFYIPQRLYIVPAGNETNIPYTRVNHNKYMVTDNVAYIGEFWTSKMFNLRLYKFHNVNDSERTTKQYSIVIFLIILSLTKRILLSADCPY